MPLLTDERQCSLPFEMAFKASVETENPVNILCDITAKDLAS